MTVRIPGTVPCFTPITVKTELEQLHAPSEDHIPAWAQSARSIASAWRFKPCLRVSVTGECNARCSFCHNEGSPRTARGLTVEQYRRLGREARAAGISVVKLSGGEPCTRGDLPEIVRAFHDEGFEEISLISNGTLLRPELQWELRNAGLNRVTVSVHTLQADRFERLMRMGADALNATMGNLKSLGEAFPGMLKLNCVFVEGTNFPDEVVPLVRYACLLEATLSVLSIVRAHGRGAEMSNAVRRLVEQNFDIVRIDSSWKRLMDVQTLVLQEGGAVELDDFRLDQAVKVKNGNDYCAACSLRHACTEGPYAFRVTADGRFKPCLIRRDNEVNILFTKVSESLLQDICL
jgi:GTP 3',8-cyclase